MLHTSSPNIQIRLGQIAFSANAKAGTEVVQRAPDWFEQREIKGSKAMSLGDRFSGLRSRRFLWVFVVLVVLLCGIAFAWTIRSQLKLETERAAALQELAKVRLQAKGDPEAVLVRAVGPYVPASSPRRSEGSLPKVLPVPKVLLNQIDREQPTQELVRRLAPIGPDAGEQATAANLSPSRTTPTKPKATEQENSAVFDFESDKTASVKQAAAPKLVAIKDSRTALVSGKDRLPVAVHVGERLANGWRIQEIDVKAGVVVTDAGRLVLE